MAVIEALDSGVPVVSLNSDNARHVLLNERLGECVVQSESDYVSLALSLINAEKRRALVMRQGAVVDAAYGEPSVIWQKIESFVLETRR
jgi:glycosyltransferase involved in cell wall biosynthesis